MIGKSLKPNLRIFKALNKKRRDNLEADEKIWKFISALDDSDFIKRKGSAKYIVSPKKVDEDRYPDLNWPLQKCSLLRRRSWSV